jgi:hypothetical protein
MRRLTAATAFVVLLAAASPAIARDATFHTPSKKIHCRVFTPAKASAWIRCDLFFLNDRAVTMTRTGKARMVHITDTIADPAGPALGYGKTKRFGPFTCTSRTTGLSCHSKTGHGFTVSKQKQSVH